MEPAYVYPDGSGFSYPWELIKLGNYTLRTKDGVMNGYNAEFQMAVSKTMVDIDPGEVLHRNLTS